MGFFKKLFGGDANSAAEAAKRGDAFSEKGDCRQAIASFSEAMGLGLRTAQILLSRGECYRALGEHDPAMQDFREALRLDVKLTHGHFFWRGQDVGEQGDRELEIAQYDVVLELDPQFALGYSARGNAYRELGAFEKAIADHTRAIQLDPRATYYFERGLTHHGQGSFALALADYSDSIRLDPSIADCYTSRAAAYRALGDDANAAKDEITLGLLVASALEAQARAQGRP
jgi:tetratricopeptide (TPR) repeat protein